MALQMLNYDMLLTVVINGHTRSMPSGSICVACCVRRHTTTQCISEPCHRNQRARLQRRTATYGALRSVNGVLVCGCALCVRWKVLVEGRRICVGVHVSVFMFINGLHVHVSLFEKFQTWKWGKGLVFIICCFVYVIMASVPMLQHSMVGPGRCTPQTTHDYVSKLYGPLWNFPFG